MLMLFACITQVAVPYDWRLPIPVMQTRDGYFTRLKIEVEMQLQQQRIKPVLVSHSYGALVTMAFMTWVEGQEPGWVDKHLHGYLNLAGPLLGLPKAVSPLLSGEYGYAAPSFTIMYLCSCLTPLPGIQSLGT
jgi:phospholipid:diacylglycerol acyltransferase